MADNLPTFKIGSHFYNVTQIVDKTLYANKQLVRSDFTNGHTTNVTIPKGAYVGKIYSWSTSNNIIQFILYGVGNLDNNFVVYDATAFSESALEAQGALNVADEAAAAAEAAKSAFEKFLDSIGLTNMGNIGKVVTIGLPLFFIGYLGIKLYGEKNKADSYKNQNHE